jgi:hypothetical protein
VFKKIVIFASLLTAVSAVPLCADDFIKLAFDIGGGVSTALNPTAQFAGISGNFVTGAGYNIDK